MMLPDENSAKQLCNALSLVWQSSMKLNTSSTFGNFAIVAETEVSDKQRDALANLGLLQLLQRSPASAAEKAMAGYEKRPSGFKRDSIAFSSLNAETLAKAMQAPIKVGEGIEDLLCEIVVTKYVPPVGEIKLTDERKAYARNAAKLPALAAKVDYKGEIGDGTEENAPVDFLRAIRAWSKAQVAAI